MDVLNNIQLDTSWSYSWRSMPFWQYSFLANMSGFMPGAFIRHLTLVRVLYKGLAFLPLLWFELSFCFTIKCESTASILLLSRLCTNQKLSHKESERSQSIENSWTFSVVFDLTWHTPLCLRFATFFMGSASIPLIYSVIIWMSSEFFYIIGKLGRGLSYGTKPWKRLWPNPPPGVNLQPQQKNLPQF